MEQHCLIGHANLVFCSFFLKRRDKYWYWVIYERKVTMKYDHCLISKKLARKSSFFSLMSCNDIEKTPAKQIKWYLYFTTITLFFHNHFIWVREFFVAKRKVNVIHFIALYFIFWVYFYLVRVTFSNIFYVHAFYNNTEQEHRFNASTMML